jgi:hypothetical protein
MKMDDSLVCLCKYDADLENESMDPYASFDGF